MIQNERVLGDISLNKLHHKHSPKNKKEVKETVNLSNDKTKNYRYKTRKNTDKNKDLVHLKEENDSNDKLIKNNEKLRVNYVPEKRNFAYDKNVISLYIGGLPKDFTENDLKELFNHYKTLKTVKICVDFETKQSLGYGYLNFSSKNDVDDAIEKFNYIEFRGGELKLMPSLRNSVYRKNVGTNIFFSNLPVNNPKLTTRAFYLNFRQYGKILSCKLDNKKNIGFVYYEDDQVAKQVVQKYNNSIFFGAKIVCGLHFDKELRNYPGFEKRKMLLGKDIVLEDELKAINNEQINFNNNLPHPNAIFVRNIPVETTEEEITDFFSKYGPIKSVIKTKVERFNALWVFVTFKTKENMKKALQDSNESEFKGNILTVNKAKIKDKEENRQTVKLKLMNLPIICNKEFLQTLCKKENIKLLDLKLVEFNNNSGTFCAVAVFPNIKIGMKALKFLDGKFLHGFIINAIYEGNFTRPNHTEKVLNLFQQRTKEKRNLEENLVQSEPNLEYILPKGFMEKDTQNEKPSLNTEYEKNEESLNLLKIQIDKAINFLDYDLELGILETSLIFDYILHVFWFNDSKEFEKFLKIIKTNVNYEKILLEQIQTSLEELGFKK